MVAILRLFEKIFYRERCVLIDEVRQPPRRVTVAFRGGVGDFFCWLPYIEGILRFHKGCEFSFVASASWPDAIRLYVSHLDCPIRFSSVEVHEHERPMPSHLFEGCFVGSDLIYHLDVWKGNRGEPVRSVKMRPMGEFYPWIKPNFYPSIGLNSDPVGGTVIQVNGKSVGKVMDAQWWRDGMKKFPQPVRLLGDTPMRCSSDPQAYGASDQIKDPASIYAAIKGAKAMIGVDSGFRNIAFTCGVPVLELVKTPPPGMGYPDYDVFVPSVYRKKVVFLNLDPPSIADGFEKFKSLIE